MTSSQIRQSFLDFFKSKQHTIVPSSSLMPDAPNLLFTNAGMNQFVPIFLGQQKCPYNPPRAADTQKCIRAGGKHNDLEDVGLDTYHHTFFEMLGNWSFGDYFKKEAIEWAWELVTGVWKFPKQRLYATVFCPNMGLWETALANAVEFARIRLSGGTPQGLGDEVVGGPQGSSAINWPDDESASCWAEYFLKAGLDPFAHIIPGNRKDNFWMMGETGPCGPCSELHVDLTPAGDTGGSLVNKGDPRCIEIWNLVFIQFNANPDGTFSVLPSRHVDTGMGFERVTSIIQGTTEFSDFASAKISNYETDIFRPIFTKIELLSGKRYTSTLPINTPLQGGGGDASDSSNGFNRLTDQQKIDVAFRVIADHIRTLSFAIADGIQPGNTDRNYVLRRILRRAVRYGRTLGFHEPFFYKLVGVLGETMGHVFPEIREKQKHVEEVIRVEEEAFNKTLDTGISLFNEYIRDTDLPKESAKGAKDLGQGALGHLERASRNENINDLGSVKLLLQTAKEALKTASPLLGGWSAQLRPSFDHVERLVAATERTAEEEYPSGSLFSEWRSALNELNAQLAKIHSEHPTIPGRMAFLLYDTYGFPLDLTELMARERGLTVDVAGFDKLMEEQRDRARKARKTQVIEVNRYLPPTRFVGYDILEAECLVMGFETVTRKDGVKEEYVIVDQSPLYAEMGGQVGDAGWLERRNMLGSHVSARVVDTVKKGESFLLKIDPAQINDLTRAEFFAHEVPEDHAILKVDTRRRDAIQRHHTVTHLLHWALHEMVNKEASQKGSYVGPEKLTFDFNNAPLTPQQVADIEKLVNERILENAVVSWTEVPYGEIKPRKDIMQFFGEKYGDTVRVVQIGGQPKALDGYSMELCGGTHTRATGEIGLFRIVGENAIAAGVRRIEAVAGLEAYNVANQQLQLIRSLAGKINSPVHELEKKIESLLAQQKELEKQLKGAQQKQAAENARSLIAKAQNIGSTRAIIENLGVADGDYLQLIADALKGQFKGVVVLGGVANNAVSLIATVSPDLTAKVQAGKIIQTIAPIVGGKGGGKPDNARGGGKDAAKLDEALAKARELIP
jgi:alanyl-tRNA synthetase